MMLNTNVQLRFMLYLALLLSGCDKFPRITVHETIVIYRILYTLDLALHNFHKINVLSIRQALSQLIIILLQKLFNWHTGI